MHGTNVKINNNVSKLSDKYIVDITDVSRQPIGPFFKGQAVRVFDP